MSLRRLQSHGDAHLRAVILSGRSAPHVRPRREPMHELSDGGGKLAMSDILPGRLEHEAEHFPKENYLSGLDAYRELLGDTGFRTSGWKTAPSFV